MPYQFQTATFDTTGTYPFSVTCSGPGGSGGDSENVIATGPLPDLIANGITPTTAMPGTTVTFSATITNQGTAATNYLGVNSFTNLFQTAEYFDDAGIPQGIMNYPTSVMSNLAGGGATATASRSISLTSTARFIRICADKSSQSNTGTITESNEGNNCSSPWTQLVLMPDLVAFPSVPTHVTTGISVNLSSVIKNQGNLSTGASFYNFFQVSNTNPNPGGWPTFSFSIPKVLAAQPSTIIDLGKVLMNTLAAGANDTTTQSYIFPSNGEYYVRACADKSDRNSPGVIAESNENNNCGSWVNVTASASPSLPDLTAGSITPITAIVNVSTTFSLGISNIGSASTGIGFNNFFQVSSANPNNPSFNQGQIEDLTPPVPMNALPAGLSGLISKSHRFTSSGIYFMRACADKSNRNDPGIIDESNENNNCGIWTTITVGDKTTLCDDVKAKNYGLPLPCYYEDLCFDPTALNYGKPLPCKYDECPLGLTNYPKCDVCVNGATNPPECTLFDKCPPGLTNPPKCDVCINGATNPPECTDIPVGVCPAGLTNYPKCDVCVNGATNPPTCDNSGGVCLNPLYTNYPLCDTCVNGLTYPTCTTGGGCDNGAINPPLCTIGPDGKCLNGASNPPVCKKKIPRWWEI